MSYVKRTLQEGETIELTAKLHWINYVYPMLLLLLAGVLWLFYITPGGFNKSDFFWLVVLCGGYGVYEFLKRWVMEMVVTNKRVVLRKGILAIDSDELKNAKIEGIEVEMTVLGRILNYGDVCFAGVGVNRFKFPAVANPREVKTRADEIVGE